MHPYRVERIPRTLDYRVVEQVTEFIVATFHDNDTDDDTKSSLVRANAYAAQLNRAAAQKK